MTHASFTPLVVCSLLCACATERAVAPTDVPPALRTGSVPFLAAYASGVQIYACAKKPDATNLEWTLRGPEATLSSRSGRVVGTHSAGPTWSSTDGSSVIGAVTARDPGPDPTAIAWLLLSAKSTSSSGVLAPTRAIQRVHTKGGVAPSTACEEGAVLRVPYTATYYFYR